MHRLTKGFSLIELLVVIAIAGLIIAITTTSYSTAQRHARDSRRIQDIKSVQTAFEQYYIINDVYPNEINGTIDDAFQSAAPVDPKPGNDYVFYTSPDAYCICAALEGGLGNALAPSNTTCVFSSSGTNYCIQNQQ